MSKLEIDRRCKACGASIREGAAFCPQCGIEVASQTLGERRAGPVATTPLSDFVPAKDDATQREVRRASEGGKLEPSSIAAAPSEATPAAKAPVGKVRDTIQRATTRARDVEDDVKHRVQKVRQISSVVLDEAGYDPSLRFVLVAAALFLLFLLVMLLNKLIG